jgi:hypothetical protein
MGKIVPEFAAWREEKMSRPKALAGAGASCAYGPFTTHKTFFLNKTKNS